LEKTFPEIGEFPFNSGNQIVNTQYVQKYSFIAKIDNQNKEYGFLSYDPSTETAVFDNEGAISEKCITRLGTSDKEGKPGLTGKHGEGLKLSAIALLRNSSRKVVLLTQGKHYEYVFEYPSLDDTERSLYCVKSELSDKSLHQGRTRIEIHGIGFKEWKLACSKILDLSTRQEQDKHFIYPFNSKYSGHGFLILPDFPNKRFVGECYINGLFVQTEDKDAHKLELFSSNLYNLPLDRDRNTVGTTKTRMRHVSDLLVDVSFYIQQRPVIDINLLTDRIYRMLSVWNLWVKDFTVEIKELLKENPTMPDKKFFLNKLYDWFLKHYPGKRPISGSGEVETVENTMKLMGFSRTFYDYYDINNSWIYEPLKLSDKYSFIHKYVEKKIKRAEVYRVPSEVDNEVIVQVKDLFSRVRADVSLDIEFKRFDEKSIRCKDQNSDNVSLSHKLIEDYSSDQRKETVKAVLSKVFEVYNVSFEEVLTAFVSSSL